MIRAHRILILILFLVTCLASNASALFVTQDLAADSPYTVDLDPGRYRIDFYYTLGTDASDLEGAESFDTFAYALYAYDPATYELTRLLFTADPPVDIYQSLERRFVSYTMTLAESDPMQFAWLLGEGNSLFDSTARIEYEVTSLAAPVPEPGTFLLLAGGLLGIYGLKRRRG